MRHVPDAFVPDALIYPDRDYLRALPITREIDTVAGTLLLCHGMGDDDMGGLKPWDEGYALTANTELQRIISSGRWKVIVAGHTHYRMVRMLAGMHFVNPGTLLPMTGGPTYAVPDLESQEVRFFELSGTASAEVEVVALRG
jgi:predicted phosphodiesterase